MICSLHFYFICNYLTYYQCTERTSYMTQKDIQIKLYCLISPHPNTLRYVLVYMIKRVLYKYRNRFT